MRRLDGLYAITPDWAETADLLAATESVLRGGCRLVQYRNKAGSPRLREQQALALRALTRRFAAVLIVNDDLELALVTDADGVHLGEMDGDLRLARRRLGAGRILGASCYQSLEIAGRAKAAGVDYIAFGSFFPSLTKPQAGRADVALIKAAAAGLGLPVAAIGGITLENSGSLVAAGANMLAVVSAVYNHPDPEQASRAFQQLFENHRPS